MLKRGDKVVMHTCIEAEKYNGKIWTCEGDEYTKGKGVYSENVVFLEDFSGYFLTEYLQKVNLLGIQLVNIDLTGWNGLEQYQKIEEELKEFDEAIVEYILHNTEKNKANAIEEYFDVIQSALGLLAIAGISAAEAMKEYPKHLKKIKDRPRHKEE